MSAMSSRPWQDDDDALMAELRDAVAATGDEEARARAAAVAAFTWRTVDQELELLSLTYDSSMAESAFRGFTDTSSPRILVFESDELTMEIQVGEDLLLGQLVPARSGSVAVESAQGTVVQAEADDAGFFQLPRPPSGTIRLRVTGTPGIVTDWLPL
jgi:hypothetical protein